VAVAVLDRDTAEGLVAGNSAEDERVVAVAAIVLHRAGGDIGVVDGDLVVALTHLDNDRLDAGERAGGGTVALELGAAADIDVESAGPSSGEGDDLVIVAGQHASGGEVIQAGDRQRAGGEDGGHQVRRDFAPFEPLEVQRAAHGPALVKL